MRFVRFAVPAAIGLGGLIAGQALAQTATLNVTAQVVEPGCSIDGGTLNFGQYVSGQAAALRSTAQITVDCASNVELAFDDGQSPNGASRGMANGGDVLTYQLYINGPDAVEAGGLPGQNGIALNVPGSPNPTTVTLHGTVFASQLVPPGTYNDVVTIQMTVQ